MSVLDEAGLVHQAADVTARTSFKKKERQMRYSYNNKGHDSDCKRTAAKKFSLDSFIFLVLPKIFNLRKRPGTEIQGP